MYMLVLTLHSWLRWLALAAGAAATFSAASNRSDSLAPGRADFWGLVLMMTLDLQLLLGLLLYVGLSPFTTQALGDFAAAMHTPALRFFAVEHLALMLGAVILAHLGRVLARRAPTADVKRARMLIAFGLATLLMVIGIPWPGTAAGRPLFRV